MGLVSLAVPDAAAEMRTWTSAGGGHQLVAEFVRGNAEEVTLRREDGSQLTIALSQLGAPDRAYVAARLGGVPDSSRPVAPPPVRRVERMQPLALSQVIGDPETEFEVDGFAGRIVELVYGADGISVGGFAPEQDFAFAVLRIRMTPKDAPSTTDVCGFFLESPQGTRYPMQLVVIDSAEGEGGKITLRDVRSLERRADTAESVIEHTFVFAIPASAKLAEFRLGFLAIEEDTDAEAAAEGADDSRR